MATTETKLYSRYVEKSHTTYSGSLSTALSREADLNKLAAYQDGKLPQFLFRAYSASSQGVNHITWFQYAALSNGYSSLALNEQSAESLRYYVEHHMCCGKKFCSHFVSFSSSFLATLRRAVWQKDCRKANVTIAVIDTRGLGESDQIIPASLLVECLNIQRQYPFWRKDFTDEEYLSWRKVSGRMSHISLQTLGNNGFYRLMPELDDPVSNQDIGLRLGPLRDSFFSRPTAVSSDELEIAISLGPNFRRCGFAMTFAFLSLRARKDMSSFIKDLLKPRIRSHRIGAFLYPTAYIKEEPNELQKEILYPFAHSGIIDSDKQELLLFSSMMHLANAAAVEEEAALHAVLMEKICGLSLLQKVIAPTANPWSRGLQLLSERLVWKHKSKLERYPLPHPAAHFLLHVTENVKKCSAFVHQNSLPIAALVSSGNRAEVDQQAAIVKRCIDILDLPIFSNG